MYDHIRGSMFFFKLMDGSFQKAGENKVKKKGCSLAGDSLKYFNGKFDQDNPETCF